MYLSLYSRQIKQGLLLLIVLLNFRAVSVYAEGDFVLEGVYEAAVDLPRILFLFKREPNGPPLEYLGEFVPNYGYLDTGASGILMSLETATDMGLSVDPDAEFVDVGIGGDEYFDVSEPLYIGTASYEVDDPENPDLYRLFGPWRFQVNQNEFDPLVGQIDLVGIPAMAGQIVIFNSAATNSLEYFSADIKDPCDPEIPEVDFEVVLRFEKFINPDDSRNIPPLPVMAYNPAIDNIMIDYDGASSSGSWLLDTGATVSLISVEQGVKLGLTDSNGEPIVTPAFSIFIGGVGGIVEIPGFEIDNLAVPTLSGYNLVFKNARICVHDIGVFDEDTGEFIILEGVFGSNFLCASYKTDDFSISTTVFDNIVMDTRKGLLGFDVNDLYSVPYCGDPNHPRPAGDLTGNCKVNFFDLYTFSKNWLRQDCNVGNDFCDNADIDQNEKVNLYDYAILAKDWGKSAFISRCGDMDNPWPVGDLSRDCSVDTMDLRIFTEEWLNECDWLNWNCRGCDFSSDAIVNFEDFGAMAENWFKGGRQGGI